MNNDTIEALPRVPSSWVGFAVGSAGGVITVLVISLLYYSLVIKRRKGPEEYTREREVFREADPDHEQNRDVVRDFLKVSYVEPKRSPSLIREGEFLMEVLEGIDNIAYDSCVSDERESTNSDTNISEVFPKDHADYLHKSVYSGSRKNQYLSTKIHSEKSSTRELSKQTHARACTRVSETPGKCRSECRHKVLQPAPPDSSVLEARAIFETVLSELAEKGDYRKFDDGSIDEVSIVEYPIHERSTVTQDFHSAKEEFSSLSASDTIQEPLEMSSSSTCDAIIETTAMLDDTFEIYNSEALPIPLLLLPQHDKHSSVPISPYSDQLSSSSFLPAPIQSVPSPMSHSQPHRVVEGPIFHLSFEKSGTRLPSTCSFGSEEESDINPAIPED